MIRIAAALLAMVLATSAVAESFTVTMTERTDKIKTIRLGEALTQMEWASANCEGVTTNPKVAEVIIRKLVEAGYMNVWFGRETIDKRAEVHGKQAVCMAFMKAFGPNGTTIKGALVMNSECTTCTKD